MRKTPAIAARILAGALAAAAHAASAQTAETPGAPPAESPAAMPAAPTPRAAAIAVTPRAGEVVLNFQGADLHAGVKPISQITARNLLIDPPLRAQVPTASPPP